MIARVALYVVAAACAMSIGGCQFAGTAGVEQQLPGTLTAAETIAINTLILRYQELQRLKMVLDGLPVPPLPPLPPTPPPVVVTPAPAPYPLPGPIVTPSLRPHKRYRTDVWPSFETLAADRARIQNDFWSEHAPSFRLVGGSFGISAERADK